MRTLLRQLWNPWLLRRLDQYLLLHYPRIWSSRLHYVLFFGTIAIGVANVFVFLTSTPALYATAADTLTALTVLIEAAIFFYWINRVAQFNIEQEYGRTSFFSSYTNMVTLLIGITVIFATSFTTRFTAMAKAHAVAEQTRLAAPLAQQSEAYCDTFFTENDRDLSAWEEERLLGKCLNVWQTMTYPPVVIRYNYLVRFKSAVYINDTTTVPVSFPAVVSAEAELVDVVEVSNNFLPNPVATGTELYDFAGNALLKSNYYDAIGFRLPNPPGRIAHFLSMHLIFTLIAIHLAVTLIYRGWVEVAYSAVFIILLLIAGILITSFMYSNLSINTPFYNGWQNEIVIVLTVSAILLIHLVMSIFVRRASKFVRFSFVALPVALSLTAHFLDLSPPRYWVSPGTFAAILLIYAVSAPLVKEYFTRLTANPKAR